ncbi:hypothetical protein [Pseudomonas congelans]|uniref:hypothetical protein n=1 Tax=Pseudomonas congelans TaxID=200452 RepID=UPI003B847196
MTEPKAMLGARYYVALLRRGVVSNLIINLVSLGFIAVHECFSEHGIFFHGIRNCMLTDTKLRNSNHRHLFACGSTYLALRSPQSLPRSSEGETMPRQSDTKEETLNRDRTLRFRVNAVEEEEIEGRARNAGFSLSALFRA